MGKSVFLHWWFSFDLQYYLISGGANNVLYISVKYFLCTLWSLALAKKSSNNINNSHAQVSRLCNFLWEYVRSETIFDKWKPFRNNEKCVLFQPKSSFRSQDIFVLTFWSCRKTAWLERLISKIDLSKDN